MVASARAVIEQVFRQEHGRVIATLISQLGDFETAEDALQDALVYALERWERDGVPDNPGAWLTVVARRRAIDRLRKKTAAERSHVDLDAIRAVDAGHDDHDDEVEHSTAAGIPDDRLKLMFTCCHPSLALETQVALTLRTLGGLTTDEIARAFLVSEPTMAQRLTRARNKIRAAGIPYGVPPVDELPQRLEPLLSVIYLIFNEGYVATSGDALIRRDLCTEAIRLGRVLVELLPPGRLSAEPRGLLALMLLHDSRREARVSADDALVLLEDQDRSRWDQAQIREGIAMLEQALALRNSGPYQLQASISALHAEAPDAAATDWAQIAALYNVLWTMTQSQVVQVNHAVAIAMAHGLDQGLALLEPLRREMAGYYPYHAARADLLRRAGQREEAALAYQSALNLCVNRLERAYFERRLAEVTPH